MARATRRSWPVKTSSFLFGYPSPSPSSHPARETAWLDGVRGLAAFLVVMTHYNLSWLSVYAQASFGALILRTDSKDGGVHYHLEGERLWDFWRLPILRLYISGGGAMVAVFFVLSGMVLSWGPLQAAREGDAERVAGSLGSSVVRRWFRLFLPCFVVAMGPMVLRMVHEFHSIGGVFEELWNFIKACEHWASPFSTDYTLQITGGHPYNYVMWTIPFEFAGSIFVYVCILGLGRIKNFGRRIGAVVCVATYALLSRFWGYWLFGFGLALTDYVRQAGGFKKLSQRTSRTASYVWVVLWISGLYFMSWMPPTDDWTQPMFDWMSYLPLPPGFRGVNEGRVYWGVGAILFVTSSCHLSWVRSFFEFSFLQYLGRVSFMLYLQHLPIEIVISAPLKSALYAAFCRKEMNEAVGQEVYLTNFWSRLGVYAILWAISVSVALNNAHFLEIWVDRPCTNFGKWVDDKLVNGFGRNVQEKTAMVGTEEEELLPMSSERLPEAASRAESVNLLSGVQQSSREPV